MRYFSYLLLSVILLAASPARAQECPECVPMENWLAQNSGACGYHGNRLPSICDADPECVQWNLACNAKRDELRACIAACMAGDPPPPQVSELDEFDRDMANLERTGYNPMADHQSMEFCAPGRRALEARDPRRYAGGQIGVVIGITGPVNFNQCDGRTTQVFKGANLLLGDCIVTGDGGRVRIRMFDESEDTRGKGPTFINIGSNSEMCFETFEIFDRRPPKSLIDMVRGSIKIFLKGWKAYGSSYSVKAGIAICGIRGSEVIVRREPLDDSIQAAVIEGHAWLGNRETRDIRYLEAGQWAQDTVNGMGPVLHLTRDQWDAVLLQDGLDLEGEDIALPPPACGPIAGRWRWYTGSIVDFTVDNRWQTPDGVHQGSWRCTVTDSGENAVVVTPDAGGWEDVVVIAPGGATLRGQSRSGVDVSAVRTDP